MRVGLLSRAALKLRGDGAPWLGRALYSVSFAVSAWLMLGPIWVPVVYGVFYIAAVIDSNGEIGRKQREAAR